MAKQEWDDFSETLRRTRSAVDYLARLRISPTPSRLTLVYAHLLGDKEDLSKAMNRLISHDKLSGQAVDELYDQYFGHELEETDLRDATRRLERSICEVAECVSTATSSANHYGSVLVDFTGPERKRPPARVELSEALATLLDETWRMAEINHQLEERLQRSSQEVTLLRHHLETLEGKANLDSLTGIANRKRFDVALREAIAVAKREHHKLGLLMVDIDRFKSFNDKYGHQLGDQVLRLVARYITECVRQQDVVARYGGEEFSCILPMTGLDGGRLVATNVCRHVAEKRVVNRRNGETLGQITLSIGVAEYRPAEPAAELVHRADEALYLAKASGRNCVRTEDDLAAES
jgi:diguanylate cyclase